jgi:hypothetical protein
MHPKTDLDVWNSALGMYETIEQWSTSTIPIKRTDSITNALWYVSNLTLHRDFQIPFITEEIKKYFTIYHSQLIRQENNQVTELSNPLHVKRSLRRQWPSDLIVEREEEE